MKTVDVNAAFIREEAEQARDHSLVYIFNTKLQLQHSVTSQHRTKQHWEARTTLET